jgi:hypothetical protein
MNCRWPGTGLVAFRLSRCPKFPFPDQMPRAPDRSIGSEIDIYHNKQSMIAIVAVRLNVILGRQYPFAPQIEPSVLIFWENMTYCSKKHLFSITFKLYFKEVFAKGKTGSSKFSQGQPTIDISRR